jgi:hypothetical protein
MFTKKS